MTGGDDSLLGDNHGSPVLAALSTKQQACGDADQKQACEGKRKLRLCGAMHQLSIFMASGSHCTVLRSKYETFDINAGPAARKPKTGSSTTGVRSRIAR